MHGSQALYDELVWGLLAERHGWLSHEGLQFAVNALAGRSSDTLAMILIEAGSLDRVGLERIQELVRNHSAETDLHQKVNFADHELREAVEILLNGMTDPAWKAELWTALEVDEFQTLGSGGSSSIEHDPSPTVMPTDHVDLEEHVPDTIVPVSTLADVGDASRALTEPKPLHDLPGQSITSGPVLILPSAMENDLAYEPTMPDTMGAPGATVPPTAYSEMVAAKKAVDPYATIPETGISNAVTDVLVSGPAADPSAPSLPAGLIRYRVVRHHARGGLGAVYVAHDTELRRNVALKEIQERYADRAETRARFLLEAEVTGGLEHPGIVPVYGLGQYADGRPYYAMRFISGESLQEVLDRFHEQDQQKDRHPGERALSLRRILSQFVDVCEAMAYAHSRGVLHRDLKPSNVMIGKFGETLVVDWGLAKPLGRCFHHKFEEPATRQKAKRPRSAKAIPVAKATTQEAETLVAPRAVAEPPSPADLADGPLMPSSLGMRSETLAGSAMGTPQYMSPEQARGQLDQLGPASDIYSLGATLYGLLTGKAPFLDRHLQELLRRVRIGEFRKPTEINPRVPKGLEAVVLKAMALVPEERYRSAKAMAQDIERWLADEPVSVYRDPFRVRLNRWMRRHRTAVTAASVLAVTGLTALAIGTVLIERERRLVSANFQLAYDAADTMLSEVAGVDLADIPQMEPVRKRLLETARIKFAELLRQKSLDPTVQLLESRTQARLGNVLDLIGEYPAAETVYRESTVTLNRLLERRRDDFGLKAALARSEHGLGVLLRKLNRFGSAATTLQTALGLRTEIAERSPGDSEARQALAETRYQMGVLLDRLSDRNQQDEPLYLQAIRDQEEILKANPLGPGSRERLARYLNNLAILESKSRPFAAEKHFREILDVLGGLDEPLRGLPGPRWQAARASNNLAAYYLDDRAQLAPAETWLGRARQGLERLTAEFPSITQYTRELAAVYLNLSILEREKARFAEAEPLARRATELNRKLATAEPQVPDHRRNLAVALNELTLILAGKEPKQAEATFAESIAIQVDLIAKYPEVADYPNALGRSYYSYGKALFEAGRLQVAKPLFVQASAWYRTALKADPKNRLFTKNLFESEAHALRVALKLGDLDASAAIATSLPEILPDDLNSYLFASMGLAECVAQLATGSPKRPSHSKERSDSYGRQAVEFLRMAVDRGLLKSSEPLRVNEFVPLRDREDFVELFKSLRAKFIPRVG